MNRDQAKLLTLAGIVGVIISIVLPIYALPVKIDASLVFAAFCFVIGVVLIVFSLAYYTEK